MASESEQPVTAAVSQASSSVADVSSTLMGRVSTWISEHKTIVYTVGGVTLIATGAGLFYYASTSPTSGSDGEQRKSKKERRKAKKEAEESVLKSVPPTASSTGTRAPPAPSVEQEEELPSVDESTVDALSEQDRKDYAARLKAAGNKAYGSKNYNEAIELYGKAILCKADPIFYSNRAACYNAMSNWPKVIEDTTAAIALDNEYVKALNRRANAYEQTGMNREALIDCTASCIIEDFRSQQSSLSLERLLKKVTDAKAKDILAKKVAKLPSSMFITSYLNAYRPRSRPAGLEDDAVLDEESGKWQLRKGLQAMVSPSSETYEEASQAFDQALSLNELGEYEAYAYNLRGTFRYMKGHNNDALEDLTHSIELEPSLTQSYIKRASMHLEQGNQEAASKDFEKAMEQNKDDPDIYYHRGQLHFILGEFADAAKDYGKSSELDKDFPLSHIQLGVTQYKMGSIASSMATFRKCRKNFPQVPEVFNYYGELLFDQQKYQEAIEQFDHAIEIENSKKPPKSINVLPVINKALAVYQWKQDASEAEQLCLKAMDLDPDCDIAIATMAQLLLSQGKVVEALGYYDKVAELSRTEGEVVNALMYAEATRAQVDAGEMYPQLASRIQPGGMPGLR